MNVARWSFALAAAAALATADAAAAPDDSKPPFMLSPRAYVELPPSPTPDEIAEGGRLLRAIESLGRILDARLVEAGVLDKKKVPSPEADAKFDKAPDAVATAKVPPPGSWRCVMFRTRDELVAVGKPLLFTINTQGTAFYCNGRDAVFAYVPIPDSDRFRREILNWGVQAVLYHRIGLHYTRAEDPPGACLMQGLKSLSRWSHLPSNGAMPSTLGGMPDSTLTKLEKLAKDGQLVPLETLFAAKNAEFDDKGMQETLQGESMLLVEMLWHRDAATQKALFALLSKYAAAARPVKAFAYAAFLEQFKKPIGDAAAIEKELRAWILEKSRALNEQQKQAAAK
jgi:hypothetical protein